MKKKERRGFTAIELLLVVAMILILGIVSFSTLSGRKGKTDLLGERDQMVGLLRQAQSYSVSQSSSTLWGVHFDNTGAKPFFALYHTAYSTSTTIGYYGLPSSLAYVATSVPAGRYVEISFQQLSGLLVSNSSSSVAIYAPSALGIGSSTISVSSAGSVSF